MFRGLTECREWCQFTSAPTQVNNCVLTSPAVKKLNSSSEPFAKGTFLAGESGSQEHRRHSPQLSLKPTAAPPGPSPSQAWRTGRQTCFPYLVLRPCWDETLNPTSSSVPPWNDLHLQPPHLHVGCLQITAPWQASGAPSLVFVINRPVNLFSSKKSFPAAVRLPATMMYLTDIGKKDLLLLLSGEMRWDLWLMEDSANEWFGGNA